MAIYVIVVIIVPIESIPVVVGMISAVGVHDVLRGLDIERHTGVIEKDGPFTPNSH